MAGLASRFARETLNKAIRLNKPLDFKVPSGLTFNSVRQAIYTELGRRGMRRAFKVQLGTEDTMSLIPREELSSVEVINTDFVPSYGNAIATSLHSPQILAAVKVLLEAEIIDGLQLNGLSPEQFKELYPDLCKYFVLQDRGGATLIT